MIVFTDEDHRQVPEPSHVEGFKDLSLIGCTISIPGCVEVPLASYQLVPSSKAIQDSSCPLLQTYVAMQRRGIYNDRELAGRQ